MLSPRTERDYKQVVGDDPRWASSGVVRNRAFRFALRLLGHPRRHQGRASHPVERTAEVESSELAEPAG